MAHHVSRVGSAHHPIISILHRQGMDAIAATHAEQGFYNPKSLLSLVVGWALPTLKSAYSFFSARG